MAIFKIFFSPTGGTRAVSDLLASTWPETLNIDLSSPQAENYTLSFSEEDLCLFAVPAFEGRVPAAALRRIQKLTGHNTPCVLAAVYGNRNINDTLLELEDTVLSLGFLPFAAVKAVAQHSALPMYAAGRPDEADKTELVEFSSKIWQAYEKGPSTEPVAVPGNRPYIVMKHGASWPSFDSEKCVHCMQCAKQCPVSAIDPQDPAKLNTSLCMNCRRCVKICPTHAKFNPPERTEKMVQRIGHLLEGRKENTLYM